MRQGDGLGIKTPRWEQNEAAKTDDINLVHEFMYKNIVDILTSILSPAEADSSDSDVIAGEGLRIIWTSGRSVTFHPGVAVSFTGSYYTGSSWGFAAASGDCFAVIAGVTSDQTITAGGAADRYDTIEIRPVKNLYSTQERQYRDPTTGVVTTSTQSVKVEHGYEINILLGTEGAGVAPNHTAGYIKIAEVYVPAGATTINQSNIRQVEVAGNNWTAEATATRRWTFIAADLLGCSEAPDSFSGQAGKPLVINDAETAFQFGGVQVAITSSGTLTVNSINRVNAGSRLDLLLPASSAIGDTIEIIDVGGNGFNITQGSGQNILYVNFSTTPGTTGYYASKTAYSTVRIRCTAANTTWEVVRAREDYNLTGYILGGFNKSSTYYGVVQALNMSAESISTLTDTLDNATQAGAGVSGPLNGYMLGGIKTGGVTEDDIYRLVYSTEVITLLAIVEPAATWSQCGIQSSVKGYILGGYSTPTPLSTIRALTFSTEAIATLTDTLSTGQYDAMGASEILSGYMFGGQYGATHKVIEQFVFSTEVSTSLSETLDTGRWKSGCVYSNRDAYILGGVGLVDSIEKFVFSTQTESTLAETLSAVRATMGSVSSVSRGYVLGGLSDDSPIEDTNIIERLDFATEVSTVLGITISADRWGMTGVQGYK